MTHDELKLRRQQIESGITISIHSIPLSFDTIPGVPDNPDEPKASEGMEAFRSKVYDAINARGWNVYMNAMAEHDFIIMELYDSSAICQDTLDGKYYKIAITVGEDSEVTLGEPEEYDITYTPADSADTDSNVPASVVDPIATDKKGVFRYKGGKVSVLAAKSVGQKRPTYRVLLVQSGFTQDGRYITRAALEDAVARGLFDGVKCYYQHPDPDDPHAQRPGLPCGFVKPGTITLEENKASEVDVWADVPLLQTDVGNSIRDVLDASLEIGVPLLGNSIYSKEVWQHTGKVHDRTCLIVTKFETMNAVDFVTEAAFPRASVKSRLAASTQAKTVISKGSLTMDEKQELAQLRKDMAELKPLVTTLTASAEESKKKSDRLELERAVDADLSASGLNETQRGIVKPVLMAIADPDLRKSQLEISKAAFLGMAKSNASGGANGTDNGEQKPDVKPLSATMQAAANAAGVKPEFLAMAQK